MIKANKGITLVALVITIVVLLILASVTIYSGTNATKMAQSNTLMIELDMVQHAILERYSEYSLTQNENILVGTEIEYSEVNEIADSIGVTLKATEGYYQLEPSELSDLGISDAVDTYIVNYQTGEVINKSQLETQSGYVLYVSSSN